MKLLKCKLCRGEVDLTSKNGILEYTKCRKCGFSKEELLPKDTEVLIIRKKPHKII